MCVIGLEQQAIQEFSESTGLSFKDESLAWSRPKHDFYSGRLSPAESHCCQH